MKIAKITEGKAGRVVIQLEDGPSFPLGKKEKRSLALEEGMELREEQLKWMMEELIFPRGRNFLICLLASKDYTIKEIEQKLKKASYPESVIEQIISYGVEKHYLDDWRYASDYIRFHKEGKSIRQLKYKLKEKGISESILCELEEADDREALFLQVQRYWERKKGTAYEKKAKTYQYFVRKGYPSGLVREIIGQLEKGE